MFNIFICDMFLISKTVFFTSHTDDNSPFAVTDNIGDIIRSLEEVGENFITWFSDNQMKQNPDRCHQIINAKEQTTLKYTIYALKITCAKKY